MGNELQSGKSGLYVRIWSLCSSMHRDVTRARAAGHGGRAGEMILYNPGFAYGQNLLTHSDEIHREDEEADTNSISITREIDRSFWCSRYIFFDVFNVFVFKNQNIQQKQLLTNEILKTSRSRHCPRRQCRLHPAPLVPSTRPGLQDYYQPLPTSGKWL